MKKPFFGLLTFGFWIGAFGTAEAKKGQVMVYPATNVSVSIERSPDDVYSYAVDPTNLPKWASGLSQSKISKKGEDWIADSPMGIVKFKFAQKNSFGVLDHDVTLPSGELNHNPLRVVKNAAGSEVVFTLYKMPKVSEEEFKKDVATVKRDLEKLKSNLEK